MAEWNHLALYTLQNHLVISGSRLLEFGPLSAETFCLWLKFANTLIPDQSGIEDLTVCFLADYIASLCADHERCICLNRQQHQPGK